MQIQVQDETTRARILSGKIDAIEKTIQSLQSKVPILKQQFDAADDMIESLNEQLLQLQKQLDEAEDDEQKRQIQDRIRRVGHQLQQTISQKSSLEREKADTEKQISECENERSQLISKLDVLQRKIAVDERELHRLQDKCMRLNSAYHSAESDVAALISATQKFASDSTISNDLSCLDKCIECIDEYLGVSL